MKKAHARHQKSTLKIFADWLFYCPFFICAALWPAWFPDLLSPYGIVYFLSAGITFAHLVAKLIVAHLTKGGLPGFPISSYILMCSFLLSFFGLRPTKYTSFYNERSYWEMLCLGTFVIVSVTFYALYVYKVITSICNYLGIYCFSIKKAKNKQN